MIRTLSALFLLLAACGGAEQTEASTVASAQQVVSADGAVAISAEPGSVAVSVVAADFDETRLGSGLALMGAYEFGPDGARFEDPVTVAFTLDAEADLTPVFLLVESEAGWEFPTQWIVVDEGVMRVIAELDHFSGGSYVRVEDEQPAPAAGLPVVTDIRLNPPAFTQPVDGIQTITGSFNVSTDGRSEQGFLRVQTRLEIPQASRGVLELQQGNPDPTEVEVRCAAEGTGRYEYRVLGADLYDPLAGPASFVVDGVEVSTEFDGWSMTIGGAATCTPSGSAVEPVDVFIGDAADDCRQGYSEEPAVCGAGVDISGYQVMITGGSIEVVLRLSDAPLFDESSQWFADFFVDESGAGVGCGISNVSGDGVAGTELAPYVFSMTGQQIDEGTCTAMLDTGGEDPVVTLQLDLAAATGAAPTLETRIGAGTFGGNADGTMASADDIFSDLEATDEFGIITVGGLCDSGIDPGVCNQ